MKYLRMGMGCPGNKDGDVEDHWRDLGGNNRSKSISRVF